MPSEDGKAMDGSPGNDGSGVGSASQDGGEQDEDGSPPPETPKLKPLPTTIGNFLGTHSWDSNASSFGQRNVENEESNESPNQDRDRSGRSSPSNFSSHSLPCLSVFENHFSAEVDTEPELSMSMGHYSPPKKRGRMSRARFNRELSYPASGLRARSLSRARERFRLKIPHVGAGSSSLPSSNKGITVLPEDEVEGSPEEEWQYKPLSFWTLPRSDKLVLISLGLVDLTLYMCLSILAPFFPKEAERRGVSNTVSGWIFGCFALVQFITSPLFGYLCPRMGSRFLFISGHFLAGGCTVLFGFLDWISYEENANLFVAFCFLVRILLAIGCTASATASFAIMANTFPDNIATVFGILETFTGVGLMMGPALGGVLFQTGGFILPFVSLGGVMILSIPFLMYILKPQADGGDGPVEPSSVRQILCTPAVIIVLVATIIGSLIWAILDPTLEPHLRVYNLSPSVVGLIFLLMSFFYALSSPIWGWIADKVVDSTPLMVVGFFASALGLLLLAPSTLLGFPKGYRAIWLDLIALMVLGTTASLALVPTFEKILDAAEKAGIEDNFAMYGVVAGLWGGAYALGEFIGPSVGGFFMDEFGFEWCMTFAAAPCIIISVILFILWMYEKNVGPTPCLIKIPKNKTARPISERTPLLSDNNECDSLPTSPCDTLWNSGSSNNRDYGSTSQDNTRPCNGSLTERI